MPIPPLHNEMVHSNSAFLHLYIVPKVPIYILDIVESDLYPIKFKYKSRGYGNLIFSDLKRNIEII